ncbi:MAG: carboxypeptidase regulatory-like domain-containing protein [Rubellimicrobium sp.]|nr:carboxypeptidase regulatory-like domain-containing protein [Rubellimicrobium sp.]
MAAAHAALVTAEPVEALRITARYDTGEPMAGAQVTIYAPDDPATAWARGETDAGGRFDLVLPTEPEGAWAVQVRQAGHGAMIHVARGSAEGEAALVVTAGTAVPHLLQRAVMVALVLWGALGTALFFRRGRASGFSGAGPDASA